MTATVKECRWCHVRQLVRIDTDGHGGTVDSPLPCGCAAKRAAGRCIDCGAPVEGKVGLALRCATHKKTAQVAYTQRWRENHPESYERVQRHTNKQRRTAAGRARRRQYERANRSQPEVRERRNRQRRELGATAEGRAQREKHRRLYVDRHPERVREQSVRSNRKRAAAKRDYMHVYGTKYVGEGKLPTCRSCRDPIPFDGRGRPMLECERCDPVRWMRKRERAASRGVAA